MANAFNIVQSAARATYLLAALLTPFMIYELASHHAETHVVAWFVGGLFTIMAVVVSINDVAAHLLHYSEPELQRYVVRILFMVPIYAIESWLALRYKSQALILSTLRDCYEAYAIHAFFKLLEGYLVLEKDIKGDQLVKFPEDETGHHMPPCCCLTRWNMKRDFLINCRNGVFQYVVVKLVVTIATVILVNYDLYGEGELSNFEAGYVYITAITNVSQTWAMYCLLQFYHTLEHNLAGLRPLPKLLCIKAVIFFTFWQTMIIAALGHFNYIQATENYTEGQIAEGAADFLICVEMFLAALAHRKYFAWQGFHKQDQPTTSFVSAMGDLMPKDLVADLKKTVSQKKVD